LCGEFDFADHGFAQRASLHERWSVDGDARADNDQILAAKSSIAVAAGLYGNAVIEEHRDFVT
jgi:hypothetical protein